MTDRLPQTRRRAAPEAPGQSTELWDRLRGHSDPARPSLTGLARETGTDKWGVHCYTPHYERHLGHLRDDEFVLLEIGVGGYARSGQGVGPVRMWRRYFERAQIVGLDIEDKSFLDRPRMTTVQGDQTDAPCWTSILERFGVPLVVIDDGSHRPADIIETFGVLFPLSRRRRLRDRGHPDVVLAGVRRQRGP